MAEGVCRGIRRDGTRCRVKAGASGFCFGHDPALAEARARGRAAGGQGRSTTNRVQKALPADLHAVQERLAEALEQCLAGELEPRVAAAVSSLARAIVCVYEAGELALRVQALEERQRDAGV